MKLEDEIRQSQFRNEHHKLAINITFTHFWLMDNFKKQLKPFGISLQQFNILRILRGQYPKPSTINLLKERMLDKSSDASRLIERLRLKGYVERVICPKDRRSVDIKITTEGLNLLNTMDSRIAGIDQYMNGVNEQEAETLNLLLDKLRK